MLKYKNHWLFKTQGESWAPKKRWMSSFKENKVDKVVPGLCEWRAAVLWMRTQEVRARSLMFRVEGPDRSIVTAGSSRTETWRPFFGNLECPRVVGRPLNSKWGELSRLNKPFHLAWHGMINIPAAWPKGAKQGAVSLVENCEWLPVGKTGHLKLGHRFLWIKGPGDEMNLTSGIALAFSNIQKLWRPGNTMAVVLRLEWASASTK